VISGLKKKLFLSAILICGLVALSVPLRGQMWRQLPENPLRGELVFEKKHCNHCHTIGGGGKRDLSRKGVADSFGSLGARMWNHIPEMDNEYTRLGIEHLNFTEEELVELFGFLYFITYLGDEGDPKKGADLIGAKGCLKCHQIGGKGAGTAAPRLDKLKRFVGALHVVTAMWNHAPLMQKSLKEQGIKLPEIHGKEMEDLTAYIREASRESLGEEVYLSPGDPHTGEELFSEKGCLRCHSVEGEGGKTGPKIEDMHLKESVVEIAAKMWNHADVMLKTTEAMGLAWTPISDQEMADLASYLYSIGFQEPPGQASAGEEIFKTMQCLKCHSTGKEEGATGTANLSKAKYASEAAMLAALLNHAPAMKEKIIAEGIKWPAFTKEDLRHLFAYLNSIQEKE